MQSFRFFALIFLFWNMSALAAMNCQTVDARLIELTKLDEQIRDEWFPLLQNSKTTDADKDNFAQKMQAIDAENLTKLKEIINACGWPISKKASSDAWLLSQHAIADIKFQHQAKDLLEAAVKKGTGSAKELALLADRIAITEGRPQEYGTQFLPIDRCHAKMYPVDSVELVNQRRLALGMQSLEQYEEQMRKLYIAADCNRSSG